MKSFDLDLQKVKGHSVQMLEWKRTDGWMEAIALPPVLMWSVTCDKWAFKHCSFMQQLTVPKI